jgi:hypothetical protein
MTHPDDATLQRWHDGDGGSEEEALRGHITACARCTSKLAGLRALHTGFARWSDAVELGQDDLADAIFRQAAANGGATSSASAPAPTPVRSGGVVVPLRRRFAWPAVAMAAAAGLALFLSRPTDRPRRPDTPSPIAQPNPPPTPPPGVDDPGVTFPEAWENTLRAAEVVRVEVQGAQSYTVMEIPGSRPGTTSAVVWIADTSDDEPPPSVPESR